MLTQILEQNQLRVLKRRKDNIVFQLFKRFFVFLLKKCEKHFLIELNCPENCTRNVSKNIK